MTAFDPRNKLPDPAPTLEELTNLVQSTVSMMVTQIVVQDELTVGEKVDQIMEIFDIWLKKLEGL